MSDAIPFIARQELFICGHCGKQVEPLPRGSYRNHCPFCLWSRHVDDRGPGDRASTCGGMMAPTALDYRAGSQSRLTHTCEKCRKTIPNVVAPDDDLAAFPTGFPQS
ncbi:MAG: RNHCP domain-containing protein [Candidatus Peribacteraceae bacterium]|nr:RNHCP domain-containing protein [Candidatus Peribacteraceae bacterium]